MSFRTYEGCGLDSYSGEIIILFPLSGKETKRSVELCHSKRNVGRKVENRVSFH